MSPILDICERLNIDRHETLKPSYYEYEIAKNITLIAQNSVVLALSMKNNDSRYPK